MTIIPVCPLSSSCLYQNIKIILFKGLVHLIAKPIWGKNLLYQINWHILVVGIVINKLFFLHRLKETLIMASWIDVLPRFKLTYKGLCRQVKICCKNTSSREHLSVHRGTELLQENGNLLTFRNATVFTRRSIFAALRSQKHCLHAILHTCCLVKKQKIILSF